MIRLKDVAAQAGVSLMTVSKVLRDAPDVSVATKAKIRRIAKEMGYVPDALAQGLRARRTKLLGLILPNLRDRAFSEAANSIENHTQDFGYDLLIAQSHDNPQREEIAIRRLLARRIDGLFIYPVYRLAPTAPVYDELRRSKARTVLLGPAAAFCSGLPSVHSDEAAASCQLTQHLLQLGHRRIAFFTGPPAAPWAQQRFEGYRRALRAESAPLDDRLIFTAGATAEDGARAAQQMLAEATAVTAVQAVSDAVGVGAATLLLQHGLRIPHDVSVTGFGGDPSGELLGIPLTTVKASQHALGTAAADTMFRLLNDEAPALKPLAYELVIRASTAPPAAGARLPRQTADRSEDPAQGDDLE